MPYLKSACLFLLLFLGVHAHAQLIDTLIDARPYQLHIRILKGKKPPILFESGGGLDASQWDSIAAVVHHRLKATVITYDRAGFGKSSIDTSNYSILREIESLETALGKLGYDKAIFLLVGHSLGGFYNRVFAARHPKQVKGMILLDPRIPSYADSRLAQKYFQSLNRTDFEPDYMNLYRLLANMERTSDYVRQVPLALSLPILDIMAETGPFTEAKENERFQNDQRWLVKEGKNRTLLLAKGSSHNIPHDRPDFVIQQIVSFYNRYVYNEPRLEKIRVIK